MKFVILLSLVAFAASAPVDSSKDAQITQYDNTNEIDKYQFGFKTSDGTSRQEEGEIRKTPTGDVIVVKGSYSYIGDNGKEYTVNYTADERGYRTKKEPAAKLVPSKQYGSVSSGVLASLVG